MIIDSKDYQITTSLIDRCKGTALEFIALRYTVVDDVYRLVYIHRDAADDETILQYFIKKYEEGPVNKITLNITGLSVNQSVDIIYNKLKSIYKEKRDDSD